MSELDRTPRPASSPRPEIPAGPSTPSAFPRTIAREVKGGLCVISLDRPDSAANILDPGTLIELAEHLDFIEQHPELTGLVFTTGKASIFVAGADLNAMRGEVPLEQLRRFIEQGQAVMNQIAALPIPTAAAIHGAALGGGYELCLACDYRVASTDPVTRIGLPETKLGLLPAWSGCTRLPRLIGLRRALDIIVGGKVLTARQALESGLVDELAAREELLDAAIRKLRIGKARLARNWFWKDLLTDTATGLFMRRKLIRKTRGHYPAVLKAFEVVTGGMWETVTASLALEREAFLELIQTEASRNLIHLFFQEERAKKRSLPGVLRNVEPRPVNRAAVFGAGVMGGGIAQWLSARQVEVELRDVTDERLASGMAHIASIYRHNVARGSTTTGEMNDGLARIHPVRSERPLSTVDLVVEAAVEDLEVKKDIFRHLGDQTSADTILATNTSALPITELAAVTRYPERVVGLHFFNPVHRMQLVEVVAARRTAPEFLQQTLRFAQRIGKLPVLVKDSPGFVANRILTPYLNEALRLFESGITITDLDEAMLDFGAAMGPMRLLDEVGLDVELHIAETLTAKFGGPMKNPDCLRKLVELGWLGRKSGRGFYEHAHGKRPRPSRAAATLVRRRAAQVLSRLELQERLIFIMVNEAARCLEEDIVAEPGDIDFVMIKGTGFAPFRGGLLQYADSTGAARVAGAMEHLADSGAPQFVPCALLRRLAATGKGFYGSPGSQWERRERKAA